jgi:hypothetical protein
MCAEKAVGYRAQQHWRVGPGLVDMPHGELELELELGTSWSWWGAVYQYQDITHG